MHFTAHARDQAIARGIDQSEVRRILEKPDGIISDAHEGTRHCYGRAIDPYTKQERYLIVIYTNLNNFIKVITVMWTDKGGLRAHGFGNI
ncbi:DUF4258 domain-containing protein [Candidatus Nitrososphaera evergladensis]|uniref:DUF4258 domain-containing protein n=1 Tax=Candidatus Nitrososphaera evergladensis TaxID=1459637 RepID=UPI0011E5B7FC